MATQGVGDGVAVPEAVPEAGLGGDSLVPPHALNAEGPAMFFAGADGLVGWANAAGHGVVVVDRPWASRLHLAEAPSAPAVLPVSWTGRDRMRRTGQLTIEALHGGTLGVITDVTIAPTQALAPAPPRAPIAVGARDPERRLGVGSQAAGSPTGRSPTAGALTGGALTGGALAGGALTGALQRDELEVCYQPVMDLASGRVVSAEAMIRWHHPRLRPLSQNEIITLGQDSELDLSLGRWLLEEAIHQASRWAVDPSLPPGIGVHVTVTAPQLVRGELVERAAAMLAATPLTTRTLCIQVSERAFGDPLTGGAVRGGLQTLRDQGVRIGLTHFGTGASSLMQLQQDPVDVLRLDDKLVEGMVTDCADSAIVATVLSLSEALEVTTIAAGLADEGQTAALRAVGGRYAVGPHIGGPLEPTAFMDAVRSSWASAAPGPAHADVHSGGDLAEQALASGQHARP